MEQNKTLAQQLGINKFPFYIKNNFDHEFYTIINIVYIEFQNNHWFRIEYNENKKPIYFETTAKILFTDFEKFNPNQPFEDFDEFYWYKIEYNENGEEIYIKDSDGYQLKTQ